MRDERRVNNCKVSQDFCPLFYVRWGSTIVYEYMNNTETYIMAKSECSTAMLFSSSRVSKSRLR